MSSLVIIFGIMTFVIPAICVLADDVNWERKKK